MKYFVNLSFICFGLIVMGELLTAFRFLTASQIMDYHQTAMGVAWDSLSIGMQTMTLNFLRAAGLGFLLAGLAMLFILIFPFRKREQWARWALFSICLTQSVIMGAVVFSVRSHTAATPPLAPFVIIGILSLIGFLSYDRAKS